MSLVLCAKCKKEFDWNEAYNQQNTPGSHIYNPPGRGSFRPRAFCPHCGFLVAEWDINRDRDANRWKWYGENANANAGRELPPNPLRLWGKSIPSEACVTVTEDYIDVKLVRELLEESVPEEIEETEVRAETPSPSKQPKIRPEDKAKIMEKITEAEKEVVETMAKRQKKGDISLGVWSASFGFGFFMVAIIVAIKFYGTTLFTSSDGWGIIFLTVLPLLVGMAGLGLVVDAVRKKRKAILGGFNEPYCSEACYNEAGKRISGSLIRGHQGVCAFCEKPVSLGMGNPGRVASFPFRGKTFFICAECVSEGAEYVKKIKECCLCGKQL